MAQHICISFLIKPKSFLKKISLSKIQFIPKIGKNFHQIKNFQDIVMEHLDHYW